MKAVLFDFNGTLYNDTHLHMRAWHDFMLREFGKDLSDDEIRKTFIGPSNDDIFRKMFDGNLPKEQIAAYSAEKEMEYRAAARANPDNLHLMEGAPELFDWLVEHGVPFALATASPMENVEFYLEDLGLKKWFTLDRIVYEEGKLASKPDPAFYIEAARRVGLLPEDCIIVEDSPTGIQAAINARAGRIIAIDRTTPRSWLESKREIYAIVHDFYGFERYI